MLLCRSVRSKSRLALIALSLLATSRLALAAPSDCTQLDAKAAGSILGVSARATANQGHTKMPPDNMDFLACTFIEVTPSPTARILSYLIYTPIAKDLANEYASLSGGNFARKQLFSPNVGDQSSGWFRSGLSDNLFEGNVTMQSGASIWVIKVGGMPSADAAKNALVAAGRILAKH